MSENKELIKKYYKKRINSYEPMVDHGIVGALLLYDALMNLAEDNKVYSEIIGYRLFFAKVCDTIALHNMWRATNGSIDSYRACQLHELIPDKDMHHIIYYNNNNILFLLALVDAIDPIKSFCRNRRHCQDVSPSDVLKNVYLQFIAYSGMKQLRIIYNSPAFDDYANSITDPDTGLSSWLGTHIRYTNTKDKVTILSILVYMDHIEATASAIV